MNNSQPRPTKGSESRRLFVLIAAMLVIGGLLAAWLGGAFDEGVAPSPASSSRARMDLIAGGGHADQEQPPPSLSERTRADDAAPVGTEPATAWTALGRCVDENGQPLAGVAVQAWLGSEDAPPEGATHAGSWAVTTGEDGRFRLDAQVDGLRDGRLRCRAVGRVPVAGRLRRPIPGESVDLGDLVMHAAIAVAGTVVDTLGDPVPGVRVMFVRIDPTEGPRPTGVGTDASAESMLVAFSGTDGRIDFDLPAWSGEWFIGAEYTGALVEPRNVQLDRSQSEFDLRIVVERPDPQSAVSGKVVDDLGRPVAGARVVLTGHGFIGRALSDDDGNVTVVRAGPYPFRGRTGMSIDVDHDSGRYEWPEQSLERDLDWGSADVEFRMIRRASRVVRVVDARGRAVEDYVLHAYSQRPRRALTRYSRIDIRGHHPGGRCTLEGLYQGRQGVIIVPDDPQLASTEVVPFEVDGVSPGPEVTVVAPDVATCRLEVVTAAGEPVAGSEVELIQFLMPGSVGVSTRALPIEDADRSRSVERALVLAAATTDAAGQAEIQAPPGNWDLRVRGDGHVDRVEDVFVGPGSNRVRVVVQVGASVRGQIGPPPVIDQLLTLDDAGLFVDLEPADDEQATIELIVGADGRYEASGLPVGDYYLQLRVRYDSSEFHTANDSYPIGRRTLADGTVEVVDHDATACLPVPVTGKVTVDGAPLGGVHCFLSLAATGKLSIRVGTDPDGRFEALAKPAEYRLVATMPAQPGPGWLRIPVHDRTWNIGPNRDTYIDAAIQLRRATLRLVDAEGDPVADTAIRVVAPDYNDPTPKRTGADGSVRIDPAPAVEFEVVVGTGEARRRVGPYSLTPGSLDGDIKIRVE